MAGGSQPAPRPSIRLRCSRFKNQVVAERNPDQMLFCDNLEIVHTPVEAGYAFAIMPDLRPARIPRSALYSHSCLLPISFGAVYHSGGLTPTLRLFLSALGTLLQNSSSPLLPLRRHNSTKIHPAPLPIEKKSLCCTGPPPRRCTQSMESRPTEASFPCLLLNLQKIMSVFYFVVITTE